MRRRIVLYQAWIGDHWLGIGEKAELEQLRSEGILPADCTIRKMTEAEIDEVLADA